MRKDINELKGKVFCKVEHVKEGFSKGYYKYRDGVLFQNDDETYYLAHIQDCCENVELEDICGDLSVLEGVPILQATEDCNYREDEDCKEQWTFYNFRTINGSVTLRFYGYSNGYYSTKVDLTKFEDQ